MYELNVTSILKTRHIFQPSRISINGKMTHLLDHDSGGSLSSITTPKGHKYLFQLQPSVMHNRFIFSPPLMPRHYYQLLYTDEGKLMASVLPQQVGRIVYSYGEEGRLEYLIYGDGSIEYGYHQDTGLLSTVIIREFGYVQRIENNYKSGLLIDQSIRFGPATDLHDAVIKYSYDEYAKPKKVQIVINGTSVLPYKTSYDKSYGIQESVQNLYINRTNMNIITIEDSHNKFQRIKKYDAHGREAESSITIQGKSVHRSKYYYNSRSFLMSYMVWRGPETHETSTNYSYDSMGYLKEVEGLKTWKFSYDDNGNMIEQVEDGNPIRAKFDDADRLVMWGGSKCNSYDSAGRTVQQNNRKFSYTARGNARYIWQEGFYSITYRHDHQGRLVARDDSRGDLMQYFYTNIRFPNHPTHVYNPKTGETTMLVYDELGFLLAMQTNQTWLWVVTDNVGSPIRVLDNSGKSTKEISRTPWGHTMSDSNPELTLHVDFQGGIRDSITGMIIFGLNMYDPVHGQWLAPQYEKIVKITKDPSFIYLHRFANNNPSNPLDHPIQLRKGK